MIIDGDEEFQYYSLQGQGEWFDFVSQIIVAILGRYTEDDLEAIKKEDGRNVLLIEAPPTDQAQSFVVNTNTRMLLALFS